LLNGRIEAVLLYGALTPTLSRRERDQLEPLRSPLSLWEKDRVRDNSDTISLVLRVLRHSPVAPGPPEFGPNRLETAPRRVPQMSRPITTTWGVAVLPQAKI
jgi:hypothetical protein